VAAILELGPENGAGFHDIQLYTLGRYSSLCVGKLSERPHGGAIMLTDSLKIAEVGIQQFATHAPRFLQDCGIRPEACDQFIMHQTATRSLRRAAAALNRSFGRKVLNKRNTIYNLAERGNTATTTHFVAVMDHILNGTIRSNNTVAFGIAASGQTAGNALYTFDDLPDRICQETRPRAPNRSGATARRRCWGDDQPRVRIESWGIVPPGQPQQRDTLVQLTCAAESCFARSFYEPQDIDLLINAGVYRNEFLSEPALAAVLAGELHMNDASESPDDKKTLAFDVASGATGFLQACYLSGRMIGSGSFDTAMVVASEIDYNADVWPDNMLGLEETASAVIVDGRGQGETGFGRFFFCDDWDHLHRFESHSLHRQGRSALWFARDDDLQHYYLQSIERAVRQLLDQTGHCLADFDVVLPPQISPSFAERLGRRLAVPADRLVRLPRPHKDLYTSSLAHAFEMLRDARQVKAGSLGLMIEVGAGIQVACATYHW
jgi:3-oxoacyl-[acyl-carrier-protein] synthase III